MYYIAIFIIGLLFGSFGSVILHRLGEEISRKRIRSVLFGRSHCPHCEHTLAWYDLFPLVSWLITGGKCRYCGARISKWYPLLELGSALVFLGVFFRWSLFGGGDIPLLIIFLFMNRCLYMLMIHDIKTMYLHPAVWWLLFAGTVVLFGYNNSPFDFIAAGQRMFVFGVGFLAFYWLAKGYVRIRRKQHAEGIGQGDVMIAPIVGLMLRKVYTLMIGNEMLVWLDLIQYFRYYVIIACLAALLLLFVTPITKEEGKRMIPFFPGMIVGIRVFAVILPLITYI